jgi:hypothetical protein
VLLIATVVLALSIAGSLVIAKVAHAAMTRLGLDLWDVLLWLGLAETPVDELTARRGAPVPDRRPVVSSV